MPREEGGTMAIDLCVCVILERSTSSHKMLLLQNQLSYRPDEGRHRHPSSPSILGNLGQHCWIAGKFLNDVFSSFDNDELFYARVNCIRGP